MKNLCLTMSLLAVLAGIAAVPAMAQAEQRIDFSSPFAFTAGLATLPAGDYAITKQGDNSGIYLIASRAGGPSAMVIAHAGDAGTTTAKPNVNFTQHDGKYYLDSIALANGQVVMLNNPSQAEGRAALMVRKVRMVK